MSMKASARFVRLSGWFIFGFGILGAVQDFLSRPRFLIPHGVALGNGAIILLGLVAIAVGNCLKGLEDRVGRLENDFSPQARSAEFTTKPKRSE